MEKVYTVEDILKKLKWHNSKFYEVFPEMCKHYGLEEWQFKNMTELKMDIIKEENRYELSQRAFELTVLLLNAYFKNPLRRKNVSIQKLTFESFNQYQKLLLEDISKLKHDPLKKMILSSGEIYVHMADLEAVDAISLRLTILSNLLANKSIEFRLKSMIKLSKQLDVMILEIAKDHLAEKTSSNASMTIDVFISNLLKEQLKEDIERRKRTIKRKNNVENITNNTDLKAFIKEEMSKIDLTSLIALNSSDDSLEESITEVKAIYDEIIQQLKPTSVQMNEVIGELDSELFDKNKLTDIKHQIEQLESENKQLKSIYGEPALREILIQINNKMWKR